MEYISIKKITPKMMKKFIKLITFKWINFSQIYKTIKTNLNYGDKSRNSKIIPPINLFHLNKKYNNQDSNYIVKSSNSKRQKEN
jgi:hypothetical protein